MHPLFLKFRHGVGAACAALGLVAPQAAIAFDGCKVILCLGGQWSSIQECVPDVHEALRCMSRGKCWPTCEDSNSALSWASTTDCPDQYGIYEYDLYGNRIKVGCTKTGVIDIASNGNPQWTRVWWTYGGEENAVIQYSDEARTLYGTFINPQWDIDLATWLVNQPPLTIDPGYGYGGGH